MSLTQLMSQAGLWIFPAIALVLFLAVFVAVVARTFTKRSRKEGEEAAQLPLADDAPIHPSNPLPAAAPRLVLAPSRNRP